MTKPKIDEKRAQDLLDVVRYALDNHEWCEYPPHVDPFCGQVHGTDCASLKDGTKCEGCRTKEKAERAARWRASSLGRAGRCRPHGYRSVASLP